MAISLNVPSTPHTTYTVTLEGVSYLFTFRWGSRGQVWYLDIFDATGDSVVLGAKLLPNTEILRRSKANNPAGSLAVRKNVGEKSNPTRFNIGPNKDFELVYVTSTELGG